jgi:hypothetical protein
MRRLLLVIALACACDGFRPIEMADGGGVSDGGGEVDDLDLAGTPADLGATGDGSVAASCGPPATLPCLDPADPRVIEVPTEASISAALSSARAGDTIQVRGVTIGAGNIVLPAYVTLRGCESATLDAMVRFERTRGVVEGFSISGAIIANTTGTFEVRDNRFIAGGTGLPGVSARSIDGLVSADVTMVVERNAFSTRDVGIEAATRYDTMTHSGDGAFVAGTEMVWLVTTPVGAMASPIGGTFENANPQIASEPDDFHPAAGSPALERVGVPAGTPELDLYRCRRPAMRALGAAER